MRRALLSVSAVLLTGAVAAVILHLAWQTFLLRQVTMMSSRELYAVGDDPGKTALVVDHLRRVAPTLPLGLHPKAGSPEETADILARDPGDLAMLQQHVTRQVDWTDHSADIDWENVARLDPDNALYPLLRITPQLAKAHGDINTRLYNGAIRVSSKADFDKALELFSEAAAKPVYVDHATSLQRQQMDAFPSPRSLTEEMIALEISELVRPTFKSDSDALETLAEAHCQALLADGDMDGLKNFFDKWKHVTERVIDSPQAGEFSNDGILAQLEDMGGSILWGLDGFVMTDEIAEAEHRISILSRLTSSHDPLSPEMEFSIGFRLRSTARIPASITPEETLPSKLAEFAFMHRVLLAPISFLALVFAGLVGLETCRRSVAVKRLARGLMPLLKKEDHLWIVGLGLALPWLWWGGITRMTPLGWTDRGMDEVWSPLIWIIQPSAGFILSAVMLLQTARWRWGVRGGVIGLGVSHAWIGWGVAALTGLSIPAAGALRYFDTLSGDEEKIYLIATGGMAACGILWLLWQGIMALFSTRLASLRPNLVMRATLPWAMTGVATLLIAVPVSMAMERHWMAKDPLFSPWTSKTHVNALRERQAAEIKEMASEWE
ncbi:hypothetical protein OKA04_13015 [Luteolibacter flavescens]|uniref:Uncharacterized protein n=1 Tax=Luteolibacter flavescens TaxID=1859460 RepID=A0ABT3FPZ8_9BACT|nr:hypothetical protein [Luteolibacter flavescens]MCW1885653.1 hypothetical protein [Luteolibacter flavescens]